MTPGEVYIVKLTATQHKGRSKKNGKFQDFVLNKGFLSFSVTSERKRLVSAPSIPGHKALVPIAAIGKPIGVQPTRLSLASSHPHHNVMEADLLIVHFQQDGT